MVFQNLANQRGKLHKIFFLIAKPDERYEQAKNSLLDAIANPSPKKLETAMENYEQLPSSEKKSKEEGRLTEMARAQKEDIIKKDRIILHEF